MNQNNEFKWLREEIITPENAKIIVLLSRFENANLIFLTDRDYRIGTIAIAVPIKLNSAKHVSSSTIPLMFGVKHELITKAIAEKVANTTNKLSIAITNFYNDIKDNFKIIFEVINKILNR
ncbi:MAG: hypothetical protein ACTSO9_16455 [Candidatus Helarchaeota archaeon]